MTCIYLECVYEYIHLFCFKLKGIRGEYLDDLIRNKIEPEQNRIEFLSFFQFEPNRINMSNRIEIFRFGLNCFHFIFLFDFLYICIKNYYI